jgi:hypothetical protein
MVEFLEKNGKSIPEYSGTNAYPMFGDDTELITLFRQDCGTDNPGVTSDLSVLEGKTVRVRFTLKEAKLYAMQFIRRNYDNPLAS